jgi:hypothetical protein
LFEIFGEFSARDYVAGLTHIVRPEDWPVMPVHHMGFSLMPFGFFSANPTFGMPYPEFLKKILSDKIPGLKK